MSEIGDVARVYRGEHEGKKGVIVYIDAQSVWIEPFLEHGTDPFKVYPHEILPELPPEEIPEETPKARASDPPTSQKAAASARINARSAKAKLLLAHYDLTGGMTDEQAADRAGLSLRSEYATRCSELRKLDPPLLEETGEERIGHAGVPRMVSRITVAGVDYVHSRGWRTPGRLFG